MLTKQNTYSADYVTYTGNKSGRVLFIIACVKTCGDIFLLVFRYFQ